mgnify:CR=1 FL=1
MSRDIPAYAIFIVIVNTKYGTFDYNPRVIISSYIPDDARVHKQVSCYREPHQEP